MSHRHQNLLAAILIFLGFSTVATLLFQSLHHQWDWTQPWKYREMLLKGWGFTAMLSLAALVGSLIVGIVLMLSQRSHLSAIRWTSRLFLEFVRDTPLLVQLLVGYFVIFAPLFSRTFSDIGWNDKLLIGILLLSLFEGAYLGEIFRGGIASIPKSQWESALAVGFTPWQTWRLIIIPQALRRVLPAVAGQFVSLIKDSSLLSVIGVQEFAYQARIYTSQTYGGIEAYVPLALGYLLLTAPVAWFSHRLESRFRDET